MEIQTNIFKIINYTQSHNFTTYFSSISLSVKQNSLSKSVNHSVFKFVVCFFFSLYLFHFLQAALRLWIAQGFLIPILKVIFTFPTQIQKHTKTLDKTKANQSNPNQNKRKNCKSKGQTFFLILTNFNTHKTKIICFWNTTREVNRQKFPKKLHKSRYRCLSKYFIVCFFFFVLLSKYCFLSIFREMRAIPKKSVVNRIDLNIGEIFAHFVHSNTYVS